MQWLSKECQQWPLIHNYYCKKAMASGKQCKYIFSNVCLFSKQKMNTKQFFPNQWKTFQLKT